MYEINWYRPGPRHLRSQHHSYRPSPATSPSQGSSSYFHPCKMLNINNRAGVTVKMESQDCVLQWAMVQMWTTLINVKWLNIDINQKIMMCSDFIVLVFKQQGTKSVILGKKKTFIEVMCHRWHPTKTNGIQFPFFVTVVRANVNGCWCCCIFLNQLQ